VNTGNNDAIRAGNDECGGPFPEERHLQERLSDLARLANALAGPPNPRELVATCQTLIAIASRLRDDAAKAGGLHLLGNAHTELGEFEEARSAYVSAVDLWTECGSREDELQSRQGLVNVLQLLGQPEAAVDQAVLATRSTSWFRRCTGLLSIGGIQEQLGEYDKSLEQLAAAEAVLVAANPTPRQAAYVQAYLHGNRANLALARGELRSALDAAHRMAGASDLADLRGQKLEAMINVGVCKTRMGDMADAWRHLDQAHQAASLAEDQLRESTAGAALSEWFALAGLCDRAIALAQQAVELAMASKARFAELYANLRLGAAYLDGGEPDRAAGPIEQAASVAEALKAPSYRLSVRLLEARLLLAGGDSSRAAAILGDVVTGAGTIGASTVMAEALTYLAQALLALGNEAAAEERSIVASESARRLEARHILWSAQHVHGLALSAMGRHENAQARFGEAIDIIEAMWWPLWTVGFAQVQDVKHSIIAVYLDYLRTATGQGRQDLVDRVLALSPWSFLRQRWQEATDAGYGCT